VDPVLLTFQVSGSRLLYDISSSLEPLSIRDQMFRAYMVVKRALDEQLIRQNQEEPILVVGAGVAGIMATLAAVDNGVPVVLVESKTPLIRQKHCRSRFVCPTQYDWPAPHWSKGSYPWTGTKMPLTFSSNVISAAVQAWDSKLRLTKELYPELLTIRVNTEFLDCDASVSSVKANFAPEINHPSSFSLVISCGGFGTERTWLPDESPHYTGFSFWDFEKYGELNLGVPGRDKPKVLISGGGDGALQDFLRIVARKPASAIYSFLPPEAKKTIEAAISQAEDDALRKYPWGKAGVLDHPIHQELEGQHRNVVNELFQGRLKRKLRKVLGDLIGDLPARLDIRLLYPCDHFSSCYALNRFLVLLIDRYLSDTFDEVRVLQPKVRTLKVEGLDTHTCMNRPDLCHGEPHQVLVNSDASCNKESLTAGNEKYIEGGPFNVVIVRHGIKRPDRVPLGELSAATPRRQIIPYYVPW